MCLCVFVYIVPLYSRQPLKVTAWRWHQASGWVCLLWPPSPSTDMKTQHWLAHFFFFGHFFCFLLQSCGLCWSELSLRFVSQSLAAGLTSSQPVEKLRALPLWLSLQYLGQNGIVQKIRHATTLVSATFLLNSKLSLLSQCFTNDMLTSHGRKNRHLTFLCLPSRARSFFRSWSLWPPSRHR